MVGWRSGGLRLLATTHHLEDVVNDGVDEHEGDGDRGADFGGEDDDDSFVDDFDDEIASEDADETQSAWHSLGAFFRRECAGATAHLLSGDAGATRPLKMRAKRKRVLGIGGVDCRLLEYRVLPPKREKNLDELVREAREEEAI